MLRIISAVFFLQFSLPLIMQAQKVNYALKGKISNWSGPAKAYLFYSDEKSVRIDSSMIDNGVFTLKATANDQYTTPLLVVTKSGDRMAKTGVFMLRFYTDAPVIKITLDKSQSNLVAIGGTLNRDAEQLKKDMATVDAKVAAVNKAYNEATPEQKESKAFTEDYYQQLDGFEDEKKIVYRQFIKSHPDSYISLEALQSFGGKVPDANVIEPPFNSLSASVRATKKGQEIAAQIAALKKVVVGVKAPDFTLHDTSGNAVSLHDFNGKYVLLDFWASWCPPCRAESPYIADALATYQKKNFAVLGVSIDNPDKKAAWIKAIHEDGVTWPQVSSLNMWDNAAAKLYSVTAIPQNFLIAPDGKIIAKNLRGHALKEKLRELLGE